jgi:hypothetical protein
LENYKAIKAGQLKDKESQNKTNPIRKLSPNQSSLSNVKSTSAENLNSKTSGGAPKIIVNEQQQQQPQELETYNQNALFENMNDSENSDVSDEDENESEIDEEDETDDDEQNYENYISHNELRYNITNDDTTDSTSRTTDVTILNQNNSSIEDTSHNFNDESPLSVKKTKKSKPDSKEKSKKIDKKTKKESSTSLNIKSKENKNESLNLLNGNVIQKAKNVKILSGERKIDEKLRGDANFFNKSGNF